MNQPKVGRNDPCPCGSGQKYKNCCYGKESKKTYTSTGKRKFKAKVLSVSDKSNDIFHRQPTMPTSDTDKDIALKFKATSKDYRQKNEEAPTSFPPVEPSTPLPEAKPFEPLQIPEGEFKPTQEDFHTKKNDQE